MLVFDGPDCPEASAPFYADRSWEWRDNPACDQKGLKAEFKLTEVDDVLLDPQSKGNRAERLSNLEAAKLRLPKPFVYDGYAEDIRPAK